MANELAARIRALSIGKIDFAREDAEGVVDGLVGTALTLDDAADAFEALAAGDVDQEDIANALVDLADIFDDVDLTHAQSTQLDGVVDRLLKSGSPEQKAAAKTLFTKTLEFGIAAKEGNKFFDDLLAEEPGEDEG